MRIIDVLVLISEGKLKEGTKIIYKDEESEECKFIYTKEDEDIDRTANLFLCMKEYESKKEICNETFFDFYHLSVLNDECEVIEPKE